MSWHRLRRPILKGGRIIAFRNDIADRYAFVHPTPFGQEWREDIPRSRLPTLNWVIPDFDIGSGGHATIFRMIHLLQKKRYRSRIIIDGESAFPDGGTALDCIREHFAPLDCPVSIGRDSLQPAWATIATNWKTAYTVRDFQATANRCYFIQDFEPWFYPVGSEYHFAEQTYRFGFQGITAGPWLATVVREKYGMKAESFGFGVDTEIFRPLNDLPPNQRPRMFFYLRPVTPRRGFELAMLVLERVAKQISGLEVILAGWNTSPYAIPFRHRSLGIVPSSELARWFNQCDVGLVLSLTNASLLPLEMMACGCVVVSNRGENVEWLLNDNNAVLADCTVEGLTAAVVSVLRDHGRREILRREGLRLARRSDWESQADKLAEVFERLARCPPLPEFAPHTQTTQLRITPGSSR